MLLLVLADLNRRSASAIITAEAGTSARRKLHVDKGILVATDSSLRVERLGDLLAAEGRLDPVLIEPVAEEARKNGKLIGDQLVADALLSPGDLAAALERQAILRFDAALGSHGLVTVGPLPPGPRMVRFDLGNAVMAFFRGAAALEDVAALVADRDDGSVPLDLDAPALKRLRLASAELRIARQRAAGESVNTLVANADCPEPIVRTAGALAGLGLWA